MTKVIRKPEAIVLKNVLTGEPLDAPPVTFDSFVLGALLSDERFSDGLNAIYLGKSLVQAFRDNPVKLDPGSWTVLCDALREPTAGRYPGFRPGALYQLTPFFDAILQAEDE